MFFKYYRLSHKISEDIASNSDIIETLVLSEYSYNERKKAIRVTLSVIFSMYKALKILFGMKNNEDSNLLWYELILSRVRFIRNLNDFEFPSIRRTSEEWADLLLKNLKYELNNININWEKLSIKQKFIYITSTTFAFENKQDGNYIDYEFSKIICSELINVIFPDYHNWDIQ